MYNMILAHNIAGHIAGNFLSQVMNSQCTVNMVAHRVVTGEIHWVVGDGMSAGALGE